jgi:hypothetical protein
MKGIAYARNALSPRSISEYIISGALNASKLNGLIMEEEEFCPFERIIFMIFAVCAIIDHLSI